MLQLITSESEKKKKKQKIVIVTAVTYSCIKINS